MKKTNQIISEVKSRILKSTNKYGTEAPESVEHAKKTDDYNGKRTNKYDIDRDMSNGAIDFKMIVRNKPTQFRWTQSSGHLVFDVKMYFPQKS